MNAIITGATKGIGKALTETFAAEGFNIAINSRSAADLADYQSDLQKRYPDQEFLVKATDMSKKGEVLAFADFVKSQWQDVEVLINNAGVFLPGNISEEENGILESQIDTNLYSAYHLTRAILPVMLPQKRGYIFNMCSIASQIAYPGGGSYSISKFALLGFSKVLREEMKDKGIRVSSVMPGGTWSDSWKNMKHLPYERLMEANDIAIAILAAYKMSPSAVVEEIVLRPQLGDL